jgi:uncharacterized membrane protein YkoI
MKRAIGILVTSGLLLIGVDAHAFPGAELSKQAKLSMAQARAIALTAHQGKIVAEELEKESGGSGLRYSFDVKNKGVTQEVGVDARDGTILENKPEGPNPINTLQR